MAFFIYGGVSAIKEKIDVIPDADMDNELKLEQSEITDSYLERCLDKGIDVLGRSNVNFEFIGKQDIGLPDVDRIISRFPQFYKQGRANL